MKRQFSAPLVVLMMAAGVAALPGAPASARELPRECTSSGLDVLCVFAKPTEKPVRFVVPEGVSSIDAYVQGAAGGDGPPDTSFGGRGGTAHAVLLVEPGEVWDLRVGGRGGNATAIGGRPAHGGINGGGAAGTTGAGGGGGRTEIHVREGSVSPDPLSTDPLIAAGGGGGGGAAPDRRSNGGHGGGSIGAAGLGGSSAGAGAGATETAGGAGAADAKAGARGIGGTGAGAGGGAGYFGGGGAARALTSGLTTRAGGAGGGSGFGLPGTTFGIAPAQADGIIHLRFTQLLLGVDITRVCAPDGPVPDGWVLQEGTDGDDVLAGSNANDLIRGRLGDDRISGGGGHDILCGDAGADVLRGGGGNDLLIGGRGRDRLDGGAGEDRGIDVDSTTWRGGIETRS
ncbi:calcium-binding protein [Sporichthya polymorpha]|uniref:calcium-binding protein n=1 Tax=Sporichthya polymorpha TaxID=35751 RepID=UPI00039E8135|nr:glycine-rich protein [Sporichthya polymorpha]